MNYRKNLPLRNLLANPLRSAALALLTALVAAGVLVGTVLVAGVGKGSEISKGRMGADIMVVAYETSTRMSLNKLVLQGAATWYYLGQHTIEKVAGREGIRDMTTQYYLESAELDCSEEPVMIFGIDPGTDFVISPWIREELKDDQTGRTVIAGSSLTLEPGDTLDLYGITCTVTACLAESGTDYDQSLFIDYDSLSEMMDSAREKGIRNFAELSPGEYCSCILLNSREDFVTEELLNDINLYVRKVVAVQTRNMFTDISNSIGAAAGIGRFLVILIWIVLTAVLGAVNTMLIHERSREFAVLRVIGASRGRLAGIVVSEAFLVSIAGALTGTAAGALLSIPAVRLLENRMELVHLMPQQKTVLALALLAAVVSVLSGVLSSVLAARHVSRIDPGIVLREET